ncbi:ABC transporter permease subunit [Natronospirillum operosum]|uniref:ABC transporter permease subunit n=1 Tax=Natronospirillum operosum TaxID=2759953 RepID=A0A4Z0W370_9GAMM|nr:ABC transporter permease subunit [Natronospirillum operosum]TGG91449.1 ABC transporter permease subunit [Natronospirillum operosum]
MRRIDLSRIPGARWGVISSPYLWMLLFFLLPFIIVARISVAEAQLSIPPFSALFQWAADRLTIEISFASYQWLVADDTYFRAYWQSIQIAFFSTLLCILIGYPVAYTIARAPAHTQPTLLLLILLPSWTSFLIRVYAWMGLLSNRGLINQALVGMGITDGPIQMLNTNFAVYVGVVYAYLPFMILPLYANLVKHDNTLLEAASDLGARKIISFFRITLPLSKNGLIAGSMLVFIPVVGEYVIPELLGGRRTLMIGKVLWQEFFNNRDWPLAAALALVMILILLIPIMIFMRVQQKELEGRR